MWSVSDDVLVEAEYLHRKQEILRGQKERLLDAVRKHRKQTFRLQLMKYVVIEYCVVSDNTCCDLLSAVHGNMHMKR